MSWLCSLFQDSLFLQAFWSKLATFLKVFSNKMNKKQPLLKYNFYYVFITSVTFVLHLTFFVSPNLSFVFFSFLDLSFFVLNIDCLFWVSALDLPLLSSNPSVMSRSCYSQRDLDPLGRYLWFLVLFLTSTYFHEVIKMIWKISHRYSKFFAVVRN